MYENRLFEAVRRPEYTGENRCWACTIVNTTILLAVSLLGYVVVGSWLAAGFVVIGIGAIWLRGYLVPGTPAFAPRLVAPIPGSERLFAKGASGTDTVPEQSGSLDTTAGATGEAILETLTRNGIVTVEGEDLSLAPDFEADWHAEMDALSRLSTDELADAVGNVSASADARAVRDEETEAEWIALSDPGVESIAEETWVNRPVAIAETAAVRALPDTLAAGEKRTAGSALRTFLTECPDCGTELKESTAVSCCGGYNGQRDVPEETLVCPDCGVRVFTFAE